MTMQHVAVALYLSAAVVLLAVMVTTLWRGR